MTGPIQFLCTSMALFLLWAPAAAAQQPSSATPDSTSSLVNNGAVLRWLMPQIEEVRAISQFASRQAQNERVRGIASESARAYGVMVEQLENAAPAEQATPAMADRSDISDDLEDVAERIQEEADQPTPFRRPRATQRRPRTDSPGPIGAAEPQTRLARETAGSDVAEERNGLGGRLLRQRRDVDGGILERLRTAAADSGIGRGSPRARLQSVLPALRENLPEVVDLITDVIEEGAASGSEELLQLQEALGRRYAQSVQEELARYRGDALDQAYLGYAIVANLRLEDALEVARQQVGAQASPILKQALQTVRGQTDQARELMNKLAQNGNRP